MELRLKKLEETDIVPLTKIMTSAFDYDTKIHLGYPSGGPDGYNDGSFLRRWGLHKYATSYCIFGDNKLIGGIILWIKQDNHNSLGCIFIDPVYENQGIGLRVWKKIESLFPNTISWSTETPIFSHRNHNFYINKCGFHVVAIENPKDINNGQFKLKKEMK